MGAGPSQPSQCSLVNTDVGDTATRISNRCGFPSRHVERALGAAAGETAGVGGQATKDLTEIQNVHYPSGIEARWSRLC